MFWPLHQENRAVAMIERVADIAPLLTAQFFWHIKMPARGTEAEHRTGGTSRLAGQAYGRAQLHHGLVEIAGTLAAQQGLGSLPESFAGQTTSEDAPQHAFHISVHHGRRRVKDNAGDGRRRVPADARQRAQLRNRTGKSPAMLLHDGLRSGMHHAGTPVVSQPAPGRQHGRLPRRGQLLYRGKSPQKTTIVLQHRGDAGLLQHDFREPDPVGIAVLAPWQVPPVAVVPREQAPSPATSFRRIEFPAILVGALRDRCHAKIWLPTILLSTEQDYFFSAPRTEWAMAIHPAFCFCQTVIMRTGSEGKGWPAIVPRMATV